MQIRRAWKPLVLATAVVAFSLFYSCKKIDPRELIGKKPVDTTSIKKTAFKAIGLRKFADAAPMGDTINKDTASKVPYNHQSEVVQAKPAK